MDEAGRGPWAGPVLAAAVVLSPRFLPGASGHPDWTRNVRIDDSKRLTPRQRIRAYRAILERAEIGIGIVSADLIDAENIRIATLRAMAEAVLSLPHEPEFVLVDGRDAPALSIPCRTIVGGDHLSFPIACASIIAKVTRDSLMAFYHRLFPEFGFDRHKGYGTAFHLEALKAFGPSILHRISFRPVADLTDLRLSGIASTTRSHAGTPHNPTPESAELVGASEGLA